MSDTVGTDHPPPFSVFDAAKFFRMYWRHKWIILGSVIAFGTIGFFLQTLAPVTYVATATSYPLSGGSQSADLASLASLAGLSVGVKGNGDTQQFITAILGSRKFAERMVTELGLRDLLLPPETLKSRKSDDEKMIAAVSAFQGILTVATDKTGVMTFTVELPDAEKAQLTANRTIEMLQTFLLERAIVAKQERSDILSRQIELQKKKVDDLNNQLVAFQSDTAILDPKAQTSATVQTFGNFEQQKLELEIKLANARQTYSEENPRITQLKKQLLTINDQLQRLKSQGGGEYINTKSAPQNLFAFQQLSQSLDVATKVYNGLLAGLEQNSVRTDEEQTFIQILDPALLPTSGKSSRQTILLAALIVGLLLPVMGVTFYETLLMKRKAKASSVAKQTDPVAQGL